MKKFGIKKTIWGIFILSILISLLSVYLVFEWYYHWYYIMLYALGGIIVTVFQTAIAYTNHTHRLNFITKIILKFKNYSN
ncbi:MAG TPA: hypothetical protein PKA54_02130 [Chitinophagaceae bacterium]|nr:hypothetical protein [Chitinophagaceae bacterium]